MYNYYMFNFWKTTKNTNDISVIAKKQLDKNRAVFESLKAYDEGKKNISTTNIKKRLQHL